MPDQITDFHSLGPPAIHNEHDAFYSKVQAEEIFRQLADDTRNPFKTRNYCGERCELMLLDMINHLGIKPYSIQRALATVEAPERLNAPDHLRNRLKMLRDAPGCPKIADEDLLDMLEASFPAGSAPGYAARTAARSASSAKPTFP